MKKTYEAPEMEICRFKTENIMDLSMMYTTITERDNEGTWKWTL